MSVAAALVLSSDSVALKGSYLEVDSAKFDDVSNTQLVRLVLGAKVAQDLVN